MTDVALDACCLINLLAAECILTIPAESQKQGSGKRSTPSPTPLDATLHIPRLVAAESLYLLRPDHDDPSRLVKSPLDLGPYFAHDLLHACEVIGDEELGLYVQYATRLDDGEAECLAIAQHRGWSLATDDRLASNLARDVGVPVLTTAELVQRWAVKGGATTEQIRIALLNIRRFAKFIPPVGSPAAEWWLSHSGPR